MPRQSSKLGYVCPVCGLDYGSDEGTSQRSTRKRGTKLQYTLSKRRAEEDRLHHLPKIASKPVEYALSNMILEQHDRRWLDVTADGFTTLLKDGTWNKMYGEEQDSLLKKIAIIKARVESREKAKQEEELKCLPWEITLNKEDHAYYELAIKLTNRHRIGNTKNDNNSTESKFNPAKEIVWYRRMGDRWRHLDVSGARQARVLVNYPSLREEIKNGDKYSLIEKGSKLLNQYMQPFSNAKWRYTWIELFWIILYAHVVSPNGASRMIKSLDGERLDKPSSKHIKNQMEMERTISFLQDFFKFIPYYETYLDTIYAYIRSDPELYKLDQIEAEKDEKKQNKAIEALVTAHDQVTLEFEDSERDNGAKPEGERIDSNPDIHKMIKIGKEMIRVRHPNTNYKKEMDEFRKGLRTKKPRRKTSSCYFDPWKQSPEVLGQLIKKGKIHIK